MQRASGPVPRAGCRARPVLQGQAHETALVTLKITGPEAGFQISQLEVRKLRLHAVQAGRSEQRFHDVFEQLSGGIKSGEFRVHEQVADQAFLTVVKEEAITANPALVDQGIPGKSFLAQAGVDDLSRGGEVPAQLFVPGLRFRFQQGREILGLEPTDVDDLESQAAVLSVVEPPRSPETRRPRAREEAGSPAPAAERRGKYNLDSQGLG